MPNEPVLTCNVELESPEILDSLCARYNAQHFNLRRFYYECSNLKYLTGLINVPKLGQVRQTGSRNTQALIVFPTGTAQLEDIR
jgi:hypothetical protein